MSKTIDERVVSMQFDNKQFESNVKTSLGTIDKLKQSLKFDGAAKGFENISTASNKVNMNPLSNAVESVKVKFSALEVMAVTALANITNSAVNAGKRIVSALTIEPVKMGFQEYETQINAVQTILANTQSKGTTLDQVNAALDELNHYADKTIYNFTEMTRNIGTFTAAGVDLDTSVQAIKGIANLAAVSGSNAQQASTAMYQLSQALAAGTVKLMDWNSVVNAGMGGQVFQDALKETARVHGIAIDSMIKKEGSFRETLSSGWLSSEILTETLSKFTGDLTDAQLKSMGYTEDQIVEIQKLGKTANDAATKVKTFTQLVDTLKEAAQSGWTQTWEILIGDFEEAKELWTNVSDVFSEMINNSAEARNTVLEEAMTSNWDKLVKKVNAAGIETSTFEEKLRSTLKDGGKDVDELIKKYGSLEKAFQSGGISSKYLQKTIDGLRGSMTDLSKIQGDLKKNSSGKDVEQAQKALKSLGYDLGEFGKEADGIDGKFGKVTESAVKAFQAANNLKVTGIIDDKTLSVLEKAVGKTEEWDDSINGLIDGITELGGRENLIQSLKNIFEGLMNIVRPIKEAFSEIFKPITANQIVGFTEKIRDLTAGFVELTKNGADKLKTAFKGLFSILNLIGKAIGGVFSTAFKLLKPLVGVVSTNFLDLAASVGEALTKFRDWVLESGIISTALEKITGFINKCAEVVKNSIVAIKDWFNNFKELPIVKDNIERFSKAFSGTFENLNKHFSGIGKSFSEFIEKVKSMDGFTLENVKKVFEDFGSLVSKYFSNIGDCFVSLESAWKIFRENLDKHLEAAGVKFETFKDTLSNVLEWIKNKFSGFNWGSVFAIGVSAGFIYTVKKVSDIFKMISGPLDGIVDTLNRFGGVLKGFQNVLNGFAIKTKAEALKTVSIAILILVGSLIALTFVDPDKLWKAFGVIAALAGVLLAIIGAMTLLGKYSGTISQLSSGGVFLSLGAALIMVAWCVKIIDGISDEGLTRGVAVILTFSAVVMAFMKLSSFKTGDMDEVGRIAIKLGASLLLVAVTMKILANIPAEGLGKGIGVIAALSLLMAGLIAVTKLAGTGLNDVGSMLIKISTALLILVGIIRIVSLMSVKDLAKGIAVIAACELLIVGLIAISKLGGANADKAGSMIMKIGAALLLIVVTMKIIAGMSVDDFKKGLTMIGVLSVLITALIAVSKLSGEHADKAGSMIMKIGVAFLLLAAAMAIISLLDPDGLKQALAAISVVSACFAGLIAVSALAKDAKSTIIALSVAIGVLAIAIAGLAMIDPASLVSATASLTAVIGVFALLIKSTNYINTGKKTFVRTILTLAVLTAIVAALAIIISRLSKIDPESALGAAGSLSVLLLSLSASMMIINKFSKQKLTKMLITLAAMVGVVIALGRVLSSLKDLNPSQAIGTATALSILVAAISASMLLLNKFSKLKPTKMLITLGVMTLVTYALASILYALKDMDPTKAIGSALALSILLIALVGAINILNLAKTISPIALITAGVMVVVVGILGSILFALQDMNPTQAIGMAVALSILVAVLSASCLILAGASAISPMALLAALTMAVILYALKDVLLSLKELDPEQAIGASVALSTLLISLSAVCILLEVAGLAGPAALFGVAALVTLVVAIGGLIAAIGALVTEFPKLEEFLNVGIPILEKIGNAIGSFFGNIVGGFMEGVASSLPEIGTALTEFMNNASGFISGAKLVDESVITGVNTLASAVLLLTTADLVAGISAFLSGGESFSSLGTELSNFMLNALPFIATARLIDESSMQGVKYLTEAILLLTAGNLVDSITKFVTGGESSLAIFSQQLVPFGKSIAAFSNTVKGKVDEEAVMAAANAGKILAELANSLPKDNGWMGTIFGEQTDLATFGAKLSVFGSCIVAFSDKVKGNIDPEAVEAAANAGKVMAELANNLPNDSSWMGTVFGEQDDLASFGEKLVSFGTAIVDFSEKVKDNIDQEAVEAAANAGALMATLANTLPEDGGWFSNIFGGKEDLDDFGSKLVSFGESLAEYSEKVSGINQASFSSSITNFQRLANMVISLDGVSFSGVKDMAKALNDLGKTNVEEFISAFSSAGDKMAEAGKKIITNLSTGISNAKTSIITSAKAVVATIINAVISQLDSFNTLGIRIVARLAVGFTNGKDVAISAFASIISSAKSNVYEYYSDFVSAGAYVVSGFASGITENTYAAEAAAAAMASAALEAAKDALRENSPSKAFYDIGDYGGEGFVNAFTDYEGKSYKAGFNMAKSSLSGVSKAITRINDIVNSNIDTQPTIRPVLDLSDVSSGIGMIDNMLGLNPSVGMMAKIGTISNMMNRNQNGANDDVITAIKSLGRSLNGRTGDTYNINGITYDDGSNIADAVKNIVRAARVERRT